MLAFPAWPLGPGVLAYVGVCWGGGGDQSVCGPLPPARCWWLTAALLAQGDSVALG